MTTPRSPSDAAESCMEKRWYIRIQAGSVPCGSKAGNRRRGDEWIMRRQINVRLVHSFGEDVNVFEAGVSPNCIPRDSMPSSTGDLVSDDTRTTSTTDILDSLQEACAHGRTEEAKEILDRWKNMSNPVPCRPPERPMVHLHPALHAAVRSGHLSTVSMLLDEGFRVSYQEVRPALANRSMAMLQVFLDHGWKINQILGPSVAPALT
ncbi:MAG: hypothetical protein Q9204_007273 [Flavoplaca sp. TL-2023a]